MLVRIMLSSSGNTQKISYAVLALLALAGLYVLAQYNYLLFHTSVELFSVVVAIGIFMIVWNTRTYIENGYLALLGTAYLFIAGVDFIHALAYKGMGLFANGDANPATQLWIAARFLEAGTMAIAPFFLRRRGRHGVALGVYAVALALVILSIFVWRVFPTCFVEGAGLTLFKKVSEYVISLLLAAALAFLFRRRGEFDRRVFGWLAISLGLTIGSELLFTFYVSVYGISNLVGHLFKLASFCLIYRAIIETGLRRPFALIFRQLKRSQEASQVANSSLEQRVSEGTEELRETNAQLRREMRERLSAEQQLRRQNFVLKAIREVNQLIVREHDRDHLLEQACTALVEGSGYSTAWITLNDETRRMLTSSHCSVGERFPAVSALFSGDVPPPCGCLAWEQRGITMTDPLGDLCRGCPGGEESCDRARMTACLEYDGVRYGLLGVTSPGELVANGEEVDLLTEVAGDIAFALHDMELEEQKHSAADALRRALRGTIRAIAATTESRDPYTAGHQRKVTELALAVGRELGLDEDRLESLQVTGLLHDVGKIAVPAEILSKPTRLTEVETALMQAHPQKAYDILKNIEFPWPIATFVLQHHERLDGSGYPNALIGDQIHLEARIIAVADVVEAISSHRPYRAALGLDAALDEISKQTGRKYDSDVVDACIRVFREKGFEFSG